MAVTIEEALEKIYKSITPKSTKILSIESALGFVLAQDVIAIHNLPPFNNSAMDGFAVNTEDASKTVHVTNTIFAGDDSQEVLQIGNALKIMTGARVPQGCNCIVPIENVNSPDASQITLPDNLQENIHIRLAGEDITKDEKLLSSGQRLYSHHITLLASQGISHIKVFQKPVISIFASGSELKMHFESLESHQLYNTNTPTFYSRAQELGCEVNFVGTAIDTLEDIKAHIQSSLSSDLIVTSGGVSVGDADFTKEAFASFGYDIYFDKVDIKPGKPTTFGKIGNTYVLNLPGNPLAAAFNFELFGQSIVLALSGETAKYIKPIKAKMKNDFTLRAGKRTLVPGFFDGEHFKVCDKFAPGMISPLANSNAYIMIDESCAKLSRDESVNIISTRFRFTDSKQSSLTSGH